jgi:signal transduction histidine kinase
VIPPRPASSDQDDARPGDSTSARFALTSLLARRFDRAPDREALERMLMALIVHPDGADCGAAWLLIWNARRGLLEGWRAARRDISRDSSLRAENTLGDALDRAARERDADFQPEVLELRRFDIVPTQLTGAAAAAWNRSATTMANDTQTPWQQATSVVAVTLRQAGRPFGLLVADCASGDADALESIAQVASGALDRLAEAAAARRRVRQSTALAEAIRAAVSAHNLAEVLRLVAQLAVDATGARGSALWIVGEREGGPRLEVTHGPVGARERIAEALAPLAADVIGHPRVRTIDPVTDEPLLTPDAAAQLSALALVPLVAYGQVLGALATYDRATSHPADQHAFGPADAEFLGALGDAAAVAIDQGRRFAALERQAQEQRDLAERLRREEKLAALGESATVLCREARNPLASIGAFARRMHRGLEAGDPHRDYLEIVMREADRLERMLAEQLEYASPESPRLRVESLNAVIQDVLSGAGEALVRRRIRLLKKLAPDLPTLLLDAERIRRVVGNVLESALEAVATGGRIRVDTRRAQQHVLVEIAHDGASSPGAMIEQLFIPFASGRPGGPAVGLGVAQQIVREHGGEIRVRSEAEWTTIFSFTLPILDNRDRRGAGLNRRTSRRDRRDPSLER